MLQLCRSKAFLVRKNAATSRRTRRCHTYVQDPKDIVSDMETVPTRVDDEGEVVMGKRGEDVLFHLTIIDFDMALRNEPSPATASGGGDQTHQVENFSTGISCSTTR